ncbi:MAG: hypothetical protein K6D03_00565 [Solobacterium sp.]|nr:hypothetical protein [Solobacterium sp.]
MTLKPLQENRRILTAAAGYIAAPVLMCIPFLHHSWFEYNYTTLINDAHQLTVFMLCMMPDLALLFYFFLTAGAGTKPRFSWTAQCILTAALIIIILLIPYHEERDFLSNLHVLLAYAAYLSSALLLYQLIWMRQDLVRIFLASFVLQVFLIMYSGAISGISEVLYGITLSVILTKLKLS